MDGTPKGTCSFPFQVPHKKKVPPKKHECVELQEKHKDVFDNKSWPKIKIFVVNTYNKIK